MKYSGEWKDDIPHGKGTHYDEYDNMYEGNWVKGQRSGLGKMTYKPTSADSTPDVYEGEWKADVRHGRGTMTYGQKNVFEGHWENDLRHGMGTMFFMDKGTRFDGMWTGDVPTSGTYSEIEAIGPATLPILELQDADAVLKAAMAC